MSTATITLYKDAKIIPSKNFVVDYIEDYLATLSKVTITSFQFQRNNLDLIIKVNKDQIYAESLSTYNYNYVKVLQNGVKYYYFVKKATQLSSSCIAYELHMDVINTYKFGEAFHATAKTKVNREHKDRFIPAYNLSHGYMTSTGIQNFTEYEGLIKITDATEEHTYYLPAILYNQYSPTPYIRRTHFRFIKEMIPLLDTLYFRGFIIGETEYLSKSIADGVTMDTFSMAEIQIKNIHLISEGISAPLYKEYEQKLLDSLGDYESSWTLYYKNSGDDTPVECYLMADRDLNIKIAGGTNTITTSMLPANGDWVFITAAIQGDLSFSIDGRTFVIKDEYKIIGWNQKITYYACMAIRNNSGQLDVYCYTFAQNWTGNRINKIETLPFTNVSSLIFNGTNTSIKGFQTDAIQDDYYANSGNNPFDPASVTNYTITFGADSDAILLSKDTINKTLSENLKIINIPYSPTPITYEGNILTYGGMWEYYNSLSFLRLIDLNYKFKNTIRAVDSNGDRIGNFLDEFRISENPLTITTRFLKDPKLLHSDFYQKKFVYDSFFTIFPFEKIDFEESYSRLNGITNFTFDFIMSRNIVSKFLFKFNYAYKQSVEDYENLVAVARNNEEVLYNSAFLNYVRTGYNYDLKQKERTQSTSAWTIGLSAAGAVISAVVGGATGNPIAWGAAVGSAVGFAKSMISYAQTTAQNEENIQRKLDEARRQSVSVLNADDYDLLYAYTDNKPKLITYRISETMYNIMDDIFYYFGYKTEEMKVPDIESRRIFNFLSCELDITGLDNNISESCKEELFKKYSDGVTFLHRYSVSGVIKWNFEQDLENWEESVASFYE